MNTNLKKIQDQLCAFICQSMQEQYTDENRIIFPNHINYISIEKINSTRTEHKYCISVSGSLEDIERNNVRDHMVSLFNSLTIRPQLKKKNFAFPSVPAPVRQKSVKIIRTL
ncbi:MAG: hypothetical protein KIT27_03785 [Legionellales bacterium]|nr:hypothetical protein [Legionellales bacterium]